MSKPEHPLLLHYAFEVNSQISKIKLETFCVNLRAWIHLRFEVFQYSWDSAIMFKLLREWLFIWKLVILFL